MLTEPEARALLHEAAATVDVDPAGPLVVPPRRPWWPALAAAAAVAVVVTGLAVGLRGDDPAPEPAPPTTADNGFRLGPDQVPSVFGWSADDAAAMLTERGYDVTVQVVPSCDTKGRALETRPTVGTIVEPGAAVTVRESLGEHPTASCTIPMLDPDRAAAWELLDLVGGRASDLALAPEIQAYDGGTTTTLSAGELATWTPLADVVEQMSRPLSVNGVFRTPSLNATGRAACDQDPARPDVPALWITTGVPTDGVGSGCRAVLLFRDGGEVTGVQVVDTFSDTPAPELPEVVGNSAAYATERLTAQGYDVSEFQRPDCGQPGQVAAQEQVGGLVHLAVTTLSTEKCSKRPLGSEVTLPSVLGLTGEQAEDRLADLGLQVAVTPTTSCETTGRADGIMPTAGTTVSLEVEITLLVATEPPDGACPDTGARAFAWELLDFLDGRGPAPAGVADADLTVDGHPSDRGPLATAVAHDLRWHSTPGLTQIGEPTIRLVVREVVASAPRETCDPAVPADLRGRTALDLTLKVDTNGFHVACPTRILLFRDPGGAVEAVVATTDPAGRARG